MAYKVKNYEYLLGIKGLSENLLKAHFTLYQGYVINTNKLMDKLLGMVKSGNDLANPEFAEMKRRFNWEWNGMRLHEYYFENMKNGGVKLDERTNLYKKIVSSFNSYSTWEKTFRATGMMRGIGWVIIYYDPLCDRIYNTWITEHDTGHLCGATPLLIMDIFEHAYILDYNINKTDYIDTFIKNIDWNTINSRFDASHR